MNIDHLEKNIKQAIKGNELPFNRFFEDVFKELRPTLLSLTNSSQDTEDVFIVSMQRFWERFVINQEKLPHNSKGYIYMMCKNAWLMSKRHPWNKNTVTLNNSLYEYNQLPSETDQDENDSIRELDQEWLKKRALSEALDSLSQKCKTLMESEMDNEIKLKDLQIKLEFANYQALVQAKYNCKKRLIRKVYEILDQLKALKKH